MNPPSCQLRIASDIKTKLKFLPSHYISPDEMIIFFKYFFKYFLHSVTFIVYHIPLNTNWFLLAAENLEIKLSVLDWIDESRKQTCQSKRP